MTHPSQTVAISATFTAEPLKASLSFWGQTLEEHWQIQFADYNQVLQTILNPSSLFGLNRAGLNVLLLRPQDLAQFDGDAEEEQLAALEEVAATVRSTLQAGRLAVPVLVVLCPPISPTAITRFRAAASTPNGAGYPVGLHILTADEILLRYPTPTLFDAQAEHLGRIPYTPAFFAALGTTIARLLHALTRPPVKLLAIDADNTLWDGVCGEEEVRFTPARLQFHQVLAQQREAGVLLALASKNNPADVEQVFAANPGLPLTLASFVSRKVNWQPKSMNLLDLADELGLSADSFLFFDDNAKEIAEMQEGAPQVLGLTLPHPVDELPAWLDHLWCLDHPVVTAADRARARSYESQQQFQHEVHSTANLNHFYETLQLQVQVFPLADEALDRAAQLTQRTNQFNLSTRRRTATELRHLLTTGHEIFTVTVADRFGDYGVTGLLILHPTPTQLELDTFLLSCRILGRGVEHGVARWLAGRAAGRDVLLHFGRTQRNAPAASFVETLLGSTALAHEIGLSEIGHAATYTVPAAALASAAYQPSSAPATVKEGTVKESSKAASLPRFRNYEKIAKELRTVPQILAAMRDAAITGANRQLTAPPVTETEQKLAAIWSDLLQQATINTTDNFFDLGGHSLTAVLLLSNVREAFQVSLSMDDVYSADLTLEKLARLIEAQALGNLDEAEVNALLAEIEGLSDEEVEALLAQEDASATETDR